VSLAVYVCVCACELLCVCVCVCVCASELLNKSCVNMSCTFLSLKTFPG